MPGRNPVPPPQLPRNAPVVDVVHPVQINLLVILRDNGYLAVLDHLRCALRKWRNFDKPLGGKPWLDDGSAAIAFTERNRVVLFTGQESLRAQILEHLFAGGMTT